MVSTPGSPSSSSPSSSPRIACIIVPNFALAALCRAEPDLREIPLALTDAPGPRATITAVSDVAARHGVRTGLTAAQGAAICASLVLRTIERTASRPGSIMHGRLTPQADTGAVSHPGQQKPASRTASRTAQCSPTVDYRRAAQAALCEVAASCSPRVEDASNGDEGGYGIAYLDARGTPFHSEHALGAALTARAARIGLDVRVGIASTKMTARLATLQTPGVTVVPQSAERRFLAPLPITHLEPDRELAATLARWGITRLGELACLSPGTMGTRLGPAGAALVRRARGEDATPLVPSQLRLSFEEEAELEHGIDTIEPLAFVLRGCLDRLAARLALRGLACGGLHLSLGLVTRAFDERAVAVAAPTTDVKVLLSLTRLHLEAAPPAAPVETIRVTATTARVRSTQLDLFRPAGPAPEHLATTLARLTLICGPGRVGTPVVVDSYRPEALALGAFDPPDGAHARPPAHSPSRPAGVRSPLGPAPPAAVQPNGAGPCRLALRAIRPPRSVEVFDDRGQPDFVRGDGLGGRVVALAGPWRLSGEWWTEERFARDYYDMSLSDGGVYRVYRDLGTAQWFVEGEYD